MGELEDQLTQHTVSVDIPVNVQDHPDEQPDSVDYFDPTARVVASGELSDGTQIEAKVTGVRDNSYNIRVSLGEKLKHKTSSFQSMNYCLNLLVQQAKKGFWKCYPKRLSIK